tara:strand:+ start:5717 stop:6034 length:318 start_codon:yes stop_codon:yes gene_type:complete
LDKKGGQDSIKKSPDPLLSCNSKCVGEFLNSLCIPLNADLITSPRYNGKLTDLPSFTINDHNKYEEVNLFFAQPLEKNEIEKILCNKIPDFPGSAIAQDWRTPEK